MLKMLLKRLRKHRVKKLVHRNLLHLPLARHPVPKILASSGHLSSTLTVNEEENRSKVVTRIGHS